MAEQQKNDGQDEVAFGFNLLAQHLWMVNEKLDKLIELAEGRKVEVAGGEENIPGSIAAISEAQIKEAVEEGAKPKDLIRKFKVSQKRAEEYVKKFERRAPERVEVEAAEKVVKEQSVTVEMIRELATEYMRRFGTADLLEINLKIGGAKKLSEIDPASLPLLYQEMKTRIEREEAPKEDPKAKRERLQAERAAQVHDGEAALVKGLKKREEQKATVDDVKRVAKKFMEEHGEKALAKLIHAHGGKKLSEVPEAKLPALYEALSNA